MVSSIDVAKKAGVSQATVSRVLNTPDKVGALTRKKVLRAIDELHYIPDSNARSLVQNKSQTIALISGPLHNPFFVDSTAEIVHFADEAGYKVNVHFIEDEHVAKVYDTALRNKIDGLILSCMLLDDPIVNKLEQIGLPYISFNRRHKNKGSYVEIDNYQAGAMAFQHLHNLGHQNILWLGASKVVSTFRFRFEGFREAFFQSKKSLSSSTNYNAINFNRLDKPDIFDVLSHLHQRNKMPSAICAATDAMAIDTINCLLALDYRIPEDISVMGIDNVAFCRSPLIQLTSVGTHQAKDLAIVAIKKLFTMIEEQQAHGRYCHYQHTEPVYLFERKTTRNINS